MDNLELLVVWVTLLAALSAASERLVEIIKGIVSPLSNKHEPGSDAERHRILALHVLSIVCGILTAYLAKEALTVNLRTTLLGDSQVGALQVVALGVLSGAGSSFWNSILSYLLAIKQIRGNAADAAARAELKRIASPVQSNLGGQLAPGHS